VREIIKLYGLSARSELSQNFLLDHNLTERIARSATVEDAVVIEVGAGPGPLTRSILECGAARVIAVEKDRRFKDALETVALSPAAGSRLQIVMGDMLDVREDELLRDAGVTPIAWSASTTSVRLIGNLPFNVGTQLLLKWLRQCHSRSGLYSDYGRVPLTLLLQKEVAEVCFLFCYPFLEKPAPHTIAADCRQARNQRVQSALCRRTARV
jgi:dimethyladenosine transferase 1